MANFRSNHVWYRKASSQCVVDVHPIRKNDLSGGERLQADFGETGKANEQPACPFGTLAHFALKRVKGTGICSRAMPFRLEQIGMSIELKRAVDLFTDQAETAACIHPPRVE